MVDFDIKSLDIEIFIQLDTLQDSATVFGFPEPLKWWQV